MRRNTSILLVALAALATTLAPAQTRAMNGMEHDEAHPPVLGRLAQMLGVRTGILVVHDEEGQPERELAIRWETRWVFGDQGLGMDFVVFDDEGNPISHWVSTFYAGEDDTIETYWVNGSLRHAGYDEITARSFFSERGGFDASGVLELRSMQRHPDEEELADVRSRYTIQENGSFVVLDERRDGDEWVPTVRFVLNPAP
ncbi:MAG: hypothetical protein ACYTF7_08025 [Planctomycetota bacterium]|jgi:hypothetical protein